MLVTALRTLPTAQRRAIVLHSMLDRSVADIARETGSSPGTVKSWLSRGRAALAEAIGTASPSARYEATPGGSDAR
jgi:RNA polymerase sigma-70 factor (ECF subfamily)